jgi:hypothetical protein
MDDWIRLDSQGVADVAHDLIFEPGEWTAHDVPPIASDEVYGWLAQGVTLSAFDLEVASRTFRLTHTGLIDNDDVGICLCYVHGAIEMGGGLLHGGISMPIAGGELSPEGRRRLDLPGQNEQPDEGQSSNYFVYEAESDLFHNVGAQEADGWSANTVADVAGHMAYGPYATDWKGQQGQATFSLMVDNNTAQDGVILTLDIFDATTQESIAVREVMRTEFMDVFSYEPFMLPFDFAGREGHAMETRVYWHDLSYVRLDAVSVMMFSP